MHSADVTYKKATNTLQAKRKRMDLYHKSRHSPDVDFSGDGRVVLDGTYPRRSKPSELHEDRNFTVHGMDLDAGFYYGQDSSENTLNTKPKRYKKRQPIPSEYAAEAAVIAGGVSGSTGNSTIASGASSLGRKVRQKKRRKYDLQRAFDSVRSASSMDFGYLDYTTLGRSYSASPSSSRNSLQSSESMEKLSINSTPVSRRSSSSSFQDLVRLPYIPGSRVRPRKRTNEPVPYVLYVILGVLLLILGVLRLLLCWWHQYGSSLWTGALCVAMGLLGMFHRNDYKHRCKNLAYIVVSFVNSLAALLSSGLVLAVLLPTLRGLIQAAKPQELVHSVGFSSMNGSVVPLSANYDVVVYVSLGLDVSTLGLLLVDFTAIRAFIVAANNHWEASYDVTGDCDHRGRPKYFNPIQQIVIGYATSFVGIVTTIIMTSHVNHAWSQMWAGLVVMTGGLINTAYCKRKDLPLLAFAALGLQIFSLLSIFLSAVLVTMGLADDINVIYTEGENALAGRMWNLSASIFFQAVYLFTIVLDIIIILGVFFRSCRHLCIYDHEPSGKETES